MITKIIDNNPISFDYELRYLGVDTDLLSDLCNESFKKELFFNSISFKEISLAHYIYLILKHNFYSEFYFKEYVDIDSLKSIVDLPVTKCSLSCWTSKVSLTYPHREIEIKLV